MKITLKKIIENMSSNQKIILRDYFTKKFINSLTVRELLEDFEIEEMDYNRDSEIYKLTAEADSIVLEIIVDILPVKVGDWINTPRFLKVQISDIFYDRWEALDKGFSEPTHFRNGEFDILGKNTGVNTIIFAAVKK